jgi:hypothetical protein
LVQYPEGLGAVVGFAAGVPLIPISIAATDTTYWVMGKKQDEGALFYKLSPSLVLALSGGNLAGVPCWALFGWWWPEKYNLETVESQKTGDSEIPQSLEPPDGKPEKKKPES